MTVTAEAGIWQRAIETATAHYEQRHLRSRDAFIEMAAWLPGGDTRSTTWSAAVPLRRCLHLALVNGGIFLPTRCEMCISTAMTEETVDRAVVALDDVLAEAERLRAWRTCGT